MMVLRSRRTGASAAWSFQERARGLWIAAAVVAAFVAGPAGIAAQIGECDTCHLRFEFGCYACIHYQLYGYNYCAQLSCQECDFGGGVCFVDPGAETDLAEAIGSEPSRALAHPVVRDLVRVSHLDWASDDLSDVRSILRIHGLILTEDGRVSACRGDIGVSLAALERAVTASAVLTAAAIGLGGQPRGAQE